MPLLVRNHVGPSRPAMLVVEGQPRGDRPPDLEAPSPSPGTMSEHPEQPAPTTDDRRAAVQRLLMDRARSQAGRELEQPRDWLRHGLALLAALVLVGVVLMGFDAFLTAMQKFMEAQAVDPAPVAEQARPIQAYAVEDEVSPAPPADQDPRPSPAPAPDTAPATR